MLRCRSSSGAFLASVLLSWRFLVLTPSEAFITVQVKAGCSVRKTFFTFPHKTICPSRCHHHSVSTSQSALAEAGRDESDATSGDDSDDEEFHKMDPAETTTQFLSGLWQLIAQGNQMTRGVSTSRRLIIRAPQVFASLTDSSPSNTSPPL
jgi:hypothetical protein